MMLKEISQADEILLAKESFIADNFYKILSISLDGFIFNQKDLKVLEEEAKNIPICKFICENLKKIDNDFYITHDLEKEHINYLKYTFPHRNVLYQFKRDNLYKNTKLLKRARKLIKGYLDIQLDNDCSILGGEHEYNINGIESTVGEIQSCFFLLSEAGIL
ncbi:MAG: hypothetical protein GF317_09735 [Candidatus Lokiarchaeota archaeon]|nr:hypothetical protein [Candidatus Lokiarchaeota archaeon]